MSTKALERWMVLIVGGICAVMALGCAAIRGRPTPTPAEIDLPPVPTTDAETLLTGTPGGYLELTEAFTGTVEQIADDAWVVAGRTVNINADTVIHETVEVGQVVKVQFRVTEDTSLTAGEIEVLDQFIDVEEIEGPKELEGEGQ